MVEKIFKCMSNIKVLFALLLSANLFVITLNFSEKQAFHSDEQWTYAHANSTKGAYLDVEIDSFYQINDNIRQRLFNHWTNSQTFRDYLTVQPEERFAYDRIYNNLKIVEHPPLYFLILHTVCSFYPDNFNKWYAGTINIFLFILIYIALFKLAKLLIKDDKTALLSVALWGFSEIGIDTVVFLRMYILQTLCAVCLMYETIKIIKAGKASYKQFLLVFLYSFGGVFTQYNSILFSFFVALIISLILLKQKNYKLMFQYGGVMALSVVALFVVFPSAWNVLFGSMRGKQVITALSKTPETADNLSNLLWQMDLQLSTLIELFAQQFFAFSAVNYQFLSFFVIMVLTLSYLLKLKMSTPTKMCVFVSTLYTVYLLSMPNMGIFHSRYFMSVAPFLAIFTVMLINSFLKQMKLKENIIVCIIAVLVMVNSVRLDYAKRSPYAFRWGAKETETIEKIKGNDVFINAGEDVIALHSMIYYLKSAKRIYITNDICESQAVSEILNTENPIVLTYSSYIFSAPTTEKHVCLQNAHMHKSATICASQRCYDVWESNNQNNRKKDD